MVKIFIFMVKKKVNSRRVGVGGRGRFREAGGRSEAISVFFFDTVVLSE